MPDHSSIWRFRQLLNTENLLEPLLEQINAHLEQNSIIVALGSINIIDATVIEAKQSRKRKGKDDNNTQDPEASYNVKTAADGKRKTTYGYKMRPLNLKNFFKKNLKPNFSHIFLIKPRYSLFFFIFLPLNPAIFPFFVNFP